MSYLGFCGTLGADYMQYMIADEIIVPRESRRFYTENILYMPHSYFVNDHKQVIGGRGQEFSGRERKGNGRWKRARGRGGGGGGTEVMVGLMTLAEFFCVQSAVGSWQHSRLSK